MRILTWNVAHKTKTANNNLPGMAPALASLSPDIIVLTEYVQGKKHNQFVSDLKYHGFTDPVASPVTSGQNQVFIAARTALRPGTITAPHIPDAPAVPSNMLHVLVPDGGVEILGIRIPAFDDSKKIRKEKRNAWWNWLAATAQTKENVPFIILGDFNTDPAYPDPDGGVRFTQIKELGYNHAIPENGDSWWGKTDAGEYGKRLDHVLLSRHFTVQKAEYITESAGYAFARKPGAMSDHAVLLVEADLKS